GGRPRNAIPQQLKRRCRTTWLDQCGDRIAPKPSRGLRARRRARWIGRLAIEPGTYDTVVARHQGVVASRIICMLWIREDASLQALVDPRFDCDVLQLLSERSEHAVAARDLKNALHLTIDPCV